MGSLNADRAENVTAAQLGASPWQAQAFRNTVFGSLLRWWCTEREAIDAIWAGGDRRERTAEYADGPLNLADRLTGQGELPPPAQLP